MCTVSTESSSAFGIRHTHDGDTVAGSESQSPTAPGWVQTAATGNLPARRCLRVETACSDNSVSLLGTCPRSCPGACCPVVNRSADVVLADGPSARAICLWLSRTSFEIAAAPADSRDQSMPSHDVPAGSACGHGCTRCQRLAVATQACRIADSAAIRSGGSWTRKWSLKSLLGAGSGTWSHPDPTPTSSGDLTSSIAYFSEVCRWCRVTVLLCQLYVRRWMLEATW